MVTFKQKGDFLNVEKFFGRMEKRSYLQILDRYGQAGVEALSAYTPKRTGKTASSWSYEIVETADGYSLVWNNSNESGGIPIAILIQYGHGTRNGGYVQGRDFINPAIRPIFDRIANDAWKEITE